jgi:hypothetical protein
MVEGKGGNRDKTRRRQDKTGTAGGRLVLLSYARIRVARIFGPVLRLKAHSQGLGGQVGSQIIWLCYIEAYPPPAFPTLPPYNNHTRTHTHLYS